MKAKGYLITEKTADDEGIYRSYFIPIDDTNLYYSVNDIIEIIKLPEMIEMTIGEFEKDRKIETAKSGIERVKESIKILQDRIEQYELEINT